MAYVTACLSVCSCLARAAALLLTVLFAAIPLGFVHAQDSNPGADNPITPPERRTLFPDQHALIALPQDPALAGSAITYTDWARDQDAASIEFQQAFDNALSGVAQGRAAAGHILEQQGAQVAVGRFRADSHTLDVDIVGTDGATDPAARVSFGAYSTNLGVGQAVQAVDSFAIAAGELSPLEDDSGAGHDEVVACYPVNEGGTGSSLALRVRVTVLDYTDLDGAGVLRTTASSSRTLGAQTRFDFERIVRDNGSDSFIACDLADVNGDGVEEVVLAYLIGAYKNLWVEVFRYRNDGETPPTLERVGTPRPLGALAHPDTNGINEQFVGTVDIAAGDFNVDGRDEVAVTTVSMEFVQGGLAAYPGVFVLSGAADYELTLQSTFVTEQVGRYQEGQFSDGTGSFACRQIRSRSACEYMRAAAVAGLFRYNPDPVAGFDFNRRQLAVVFNMPFVEGGGLRVLALDISNDLQQIERVGEVTTIAQQACAASFCPSSPRFAVGAGGYVGAADIQNPLWSLVVSNWEATQSGSADLQSRGQFRLSWLKPLPPGSAGGFSLAQDGVLFDGAALSGPTPGRLPVAAWDREGNSVWLGSPVHLVVANLIKTDFIIKEPPKHAYWWPPTATDPADGEIIDVSRKYGFYVELRDEQEVTYSSTHKEQTDWSIGGSTAVTGKGTVTGGVDAGLFGSKVTASLSVTGKIGYDYNENEESYNSSYREQTTSYTGQTNADDYVIAELMLMDVWRFPVSGIELEDGLNPFWEIVFPGKTVRVQAGGLSFDWYQPQTENGNLLSYSRLSGGEHRPVDCCAEFTFVEDGAEKTEAVPFLEDELLAWDGISNTIDLVFSERSGEGSTREYTHTLSESLDVQVGYKAEYKTLGGKASAETTVDVNLNNSNSWAEVEIESSSTNNSTGFKLQKPLGNPNASYFFLPVFYLAQDGTTKVSYAVDLLGTGTTFWPSLYGQLPDPALNLPRRFSPTTPNRPDQIVWLVNEADDAKRLRGFFVRYNELSAADDFPLVEGAVTDGEVLRLEALVYNYSTARGADGLDVAFEAVAYDPSNNQETGPRVALDCGPGSVTRLSLDPRARKSAICVWDSSGFGPNVIGAIQDYRIYVTLDPDGTIDELYDTTVGPGQNNQGWGLLSVAHRQETYGTPRITEIVPAGGDVFLSGDSLAIQVDGELLSHDVEVLREQLAPLRVCASTDQTQTANHHVLVWLGDPVDGGKLIADKLLPGIDSNGDSCAWLPTFRLSKAGEFTLYAQLIEDREDGLPGNAVATLDVTVHDIPAAAPRSAAGWASHVGRDGERGAFKLRAQFDPSAQPDLRNSRLVFSDFLFDSGGEGELIPGVAEQSGQSLVLQASAFRGGTAFYATPKGVKPEVSARVRVGNKGLQLELSVRRAEVVEPQNCHDQRYPKVALDTNVLLYDAGGAPMRLSLTEHWRCVLDREGNVRGLRLHEAHADRLEH